MLVYLFRNANDNRSFAYSRDVTARNLPGEHEKWQFVSALEAKQLTTQSEALQRLLADGFYLFKWYADLTQAPCNC